MYLPGFLIRCLDRGHSNDLGEFVDNIYGWHKQDSKVKRCREPFLSEILPVAQKLETSEDKDRIFGMLGLKEWPHGIPNLLAPDYEKPINEIFRDATRYAIEEASDEVLWVWHKIHLRSTEELDSKKLLSWVPDWSRAWDAVTDPAPFLSDFDCDDGIKSVRETSYASDSEPDILVVGGFEVCKIIEVSPVLTYEIADDLESVRTWLHESISLIQGKEQAKNDVPSILLAEANSEGQRTAEADLLAFEEFAAMLEKGNYRPKDLWAIATRENPDTDDRKRAAGRYHSAFRHACINRRVFRTVFGYAGIGPKVARENDIVVVLYGGQHPFVLRPRGDEYRLLGPCYVYGIMDGEVTRKHREDGKPDAVFHLR